MSQLSDTTRSPAHHTDPDVPEAQQEFPAPVQSPEGPNRTTSANSATPAAEPWPVVRMVGFRWIALFILLFILSLPFPYYYLPDVGTWLSPLFEWLARWSGRNIFGTDPSLSSALVSDSTSLFLHTANLAMIALIGCGVWSILDRRRTDYARESRWLVVIAGYYLASQLFLYGFDKVFKVQFYLPEPNTLFTTVGETPRDLLYWSVMGASRPYTMFTGALECTAALLLLFRSTRTLGGLVALGVFLNVVAINLSFDISVKLYSSFLLLLTLVVIAPEAKRLRNFFLGKEVLPRQQYNPSPKTAKAYLLYAGLKGAAIILILFDVLAPYVAAGNFNDDTAPRPPLHGAYRVTAFRENTETASTPANRWKRVFVHRRGYFIVQTEDGALHDYELRLDTLHRRMLLSDPPNTTQSSLHYSLSRPHHANGAGAADTTTLRIWGTLRGDSIDAETVMLNLNDLPLLRNEFHWRGDAP